MADTTSSHVLLSGPRQYALVFNLLSDGTDRTTTIIDKSTLSTAWKEEPGKLVIKSVKWANQGFTVLKLAFDHTTDDLAMFIPGNDSGEMCFGGLGGIKDPASAGGTGDLTVTTVGATAGDTFTILVECFITG